MLSPEERYSCDEWAASTAYAGTRGARHTETSTPPIKIPPFTVPDEEHHRREGEGEKRSARFEVPKWPRLQRPWNRSGNGSSSTSFAPSVSSDFFLFFHFPFFSFQIALIRVLDCCAVVFSKCFSFFGG